MTRTSWPTTITSPEVSTNPTYSITFTITTTPTFSATVTITNTSVVDLSATSAGTASTATSKIPYFAKIICCCVQTHFSKNRYQYEVQQLGSRTIKISAGTQQQRKLEGDRYTIINGVDNHNEIHSPKTYQIGHGCSSGNGHL